MTHVNVHSFSDARPASREMREDARSFVLDELEARMRSFCARIDLARRPGARSNCPEHLFCTDAQKLAAARRLDD